MAGKELNSTDEQYMDKRTLLIMSHLALFLINRPLLVLNLMANIFIGFCLMTRKTQQVKQPLKILLASMVFFTILYLLSFTLMTFVLEWVKSHVVAGITYNIMTFLMRVNMTTYVWLMFYYYTMWFRPSEPSSFG